MTSLKSLGAIVVGGAIISQTVLQRVDAQQVEPIVVAQEAADATSLGVIDGVAWILTGAGAVVGYITNAAGEVVQTIFPASIENLTEEECLNLPDSINWQAYKRWVGGRYVDQKLGTCFITD